MEEDFSHHGAHFNHSVYHNCSYIYCSGLKVLSLWVSTCPVYTQCYLDFLYSGVTDYFDAVFGHLHYSSYAVEASNGELICNAQQ